VVDKKQISLARDKTKADPSANETRGTQVMVLWTLITIQKLTMSV
jgi:hypothetical protein